MPSTKFSTSNRLRSLLPPPSTKTSKHSSNKEDTKPSNAKLPNAKDLFQIASSAWKGVETNRYEKHNGNELFRGRDLVQWLLYQCQYPDTEEYREYVIKLAQAFIDKRYVVRVTSPLRMFGWLRKRRVNTTFSNDKYLYDFNDVAVSNIHVVVLVECANNLMGRDRNGMSDPLCKVSLSGRQTTKTRVIMAKTSPVWNEVFIFGVKDVLTQHLIFEVADYDFGKQADFLGYARLPLINVVQEKVLQSKELAKAQLQRWITPVKGDRNRFRGYSNANMLLQNNDRVRRDEATSSIANYERLLNESSSNGGGNINDVNLLFGDGNRIFKNAMHELILGPGPTHSMKYVRGSIRIGAFLREFNPNCLHGENDDNYDDDNNDGDDDSITSTKKYQLYCRVMHARNVHGKGGMMPIGNYVPLLRWMNRVSLKCNEQKIYSQYVYKTTGPHWEEIISMEIINFENEFARIKMYQCGQAKTDARCVGELSIPLSLIQIIHPKEEEDATRKPTLSSSNNNTDQSLQQAMENDELLAAIRPSDIPSPQWMPLTYTWDDYTSHNGDILLSMWLVPKSGLGLFGEVREEHVQNSIKENERLNIPEPLTNVCCDQVVPIPLALLRSELWSKNSPVMKAHFVEKGYKDITVGEWKHASGSSNGVDHNNDDNNGSLPPRTSPSSSISSSDDSIEIHDNNSGIHRDCSYLFPASAMVSANMAYEVQTILAKNDLKGGFIVNSLTHNPDVPYGKTFKTENQFVFHWVGPKATRIIISSRVNFSKRPVGFIASQIENGVAKGTKDSSRMLLDLLMSTAGNTSNKKKKSTPQKCTKLTKKICIVITSLIMGLLLGYFAGFLHHAPWISDSSNESDVIKNDVSTPTITITASLPNDNLNGNDKSRKIVEKELCTGLCEKEL
jgi:hypothetical protein